MSNTVDQFLSALYQEKYQEALSNTTKSFQKFVSIKEMVSLSENYSLNKTTKFKSSNIKIDLDNGGQISGMIANQNQSIPIIFQFLTEDKQFKIHSIYFEPSGLFTSDSKFSLPNAQQQKQLIQEALKAIGNSLINQDPKIIHDFMGKNVQDIFTPQEIFRKIKDLTPMAHDILNTAKQPCLSKPIYVDENGCLNINLNVFIKNPADNKVKILQIDLQYAYFPYNWKIIGFNING
jgi:hypothetical protein